MVLAFIGLGYALMHFGGRDRGVTEIALASAAPSLVVGRVWRTVSLLELAVGAAVSLVVVLVPLLTPLGVSRARDLESYLYAVVFFLVVRGFARDDERRRLVATAILCLGIVETLDVARVWEGEHDPTFQVVGTFYWHNQFGAFATGLALLSSAMVMRSRQIEDGVAWLVAPLFLALTWLSQSRAAILALLLGWMALIVVVLLHRKWWAVARMACVVGLAFATHALFVAAASGSGQVHGFSPAKDTLSSTSVFRLTAGKEAMRVFAGSPWLSHGYGSLGVAGWRHAAVGSTISPYAHSAEAQALVDGGLLLGIPVIFAVGLFVWSVARNGYWACRQGQRLDWLRLGACLAAGALLLHTSMDFDSQYSVLNALLAAFVAMSASGVDPVGAARRLPLRLIAVAAIVLCTVLGGLLVRSFFQTSHRLDLATSFLSTDSARTISVIRQALADDRFTDPRVAVFIVEAQNEGYVFDDSTLRRALRQSQSYATLNLPFAAVWDRVKAEVGAASPPTSPTTTRP